VLHRPTPVPDRIILTWAGNPATSQAVTWRTDTSVQKPVAQIAIDEDGPLFVKTAKLVEASSEKFTSDLNEALYHSVEFTGLQPDTIYAYRVGDGANWSEWNQFRTASDRAAPLEPDVENVLLLLVDLLGGLGLGPLDRTIAIGLEDRGDHEEDQKQERDVGQRGRRDLGRGLGLTLETTLHRHRLLLQDLE